MAKQSVKQFADIAGMPVELLLTKLQESGINADGEDYEISDEEKLTLLTYLRQGSAAGAATKSTPDSAAEKKITLTRRKTTELKTVGNTGRSRTVNVQVRGKKTYVKRDPVALEDEAVEQASTAPISEPSVNTEVNDEVKANISEAEAAAKEELKEAVEAPEPEVVVDEATLLKQREEEEIRRMQREVLEAAEQNRQAEEEERRMLEEARKAEEEFKEQEKARIAEAERQAAAAPKSTPPADARKDGKSKRGKKDDRRGGGRAELHIAAGKAGRRRKKPSRQRQVNVQVDNEHTFAKPTAPVIRTVEVGEMTTVSELSQGMAVKAGEVIKVLMGMGAMVTINQPIDQDTAQLVIEEMGHIFKSKQAEDAETELLGEQDQGNEEGLETRSPVVTVMGHVDHGKTSLLDYIRKAKVASGEAGGITQHIGAYHVDMDSGKGITFLDTPGHAAFTAMRARGAEATDIVILVVAADDAVMPQTIEAIEHSRAAEVPVVVAVNKCDREEADPERVRNELAKHEVIPEEWGGDVQFINVSAHTGEGIDELLDAVALQAEVLELKAAVDAPARGLVIESSLEKGRGPVATVLVQGGTLKQGDMILCGQEFGRVRAMFDEAGKPIESAGPSMPAVILGLSGVPNAGDEALVVANERKAREVAELRQARIRETKLQRQQAAKLENMLENMTSGELARVNVVLKADVQGSAQALRDALTNLSNDEVRVNVVSAGVGAINETDVTLAEASGALLVGFNVRADSQARRNLEDNEQDVHYFSVIYDAIDTLKTAISGLMKPIIKENIVGLADVREAFRSSKFGTVAGCLIVDGYVRRDFPIRVLRDSVVIFEGELESLRRFKDDVNKVESGTECGIGVRNYTDVRAGDQIECFERFEVERKL